MTNDLVSTPGGDMTEWRACWMVMCITRRRLWWLREAELAETLDCMSANLMFGPRIDRSKIGARIFAGRILGDRVWRYERGLRAVHKILRGNPRVAGDLRSSSRVSLSLRARSGSRNPG